MRVTTPGREAGVHVYERGRGLLTDCEIFENGGPLRPLTGETSVLSTALKGSYLQYVFFD